MTVKEIRAFNRFYTNLIGALDYSRHLHTPFTLTEARVLYELAHTAPADAADLRAELSLDAGHLSRMLGKFEKQGLVTRRPSAQDSRRQRVELTDHGREVNAQLEERSEEAVNTSLGHVGPEDRLRLVEAMRTVRTLMRGTGATADTRVALRGPLPGDLGWVVERNGALYASELGWNMEYEALVARIVAQFGASHDPKREAAWIAEVDGERAGSVFCVADEEPDTARLRLLLVEPSARGRGIGRRLVDECVGFARSAGYTALVLWTNDVQVDARGIYERAGFELVAEHLHRSFGQDLVGQDWRLAL